MEKKKLIPYIAITLLIFLVSSFLYFYYFHFLLKPKYFTDISKLYSFFTEYMKDEVDSHLQLLNCSPKEYYYDNSNLCFVCRKMHPCFGFGWVNRNGIEKMNPKGIPYLSRVKGFDVKIADFCEDGLASEFDCRKINENSLECENIRLISVNRDEIFKCDEIKVILREDGGFKNFAESFCKVKKEEIGKTTESLAFCGRYIIELEENKEIIIGEK